MIRKSEQSEKKKCATREIHMLNDVNHVKFWDQVLQVL